MGGSVDLTIGAVYIEASDDNEIINYIGRLDDAAYGYF